MVATLESLWFGMYATANALGHMNERVACVSNVVDEDHMDNQELTSHSHGSTVSPYRLFMPLYR